MTSKPAAPKYKLDMFKDVLPALDRRDFEFMSRQSDEDRKGFHPPVVMRFASATKSRNAAELAIWMINERANINLHDLYQHPDLQWRLLASCGLGREQREWIPNAKSGRKTDIISAFLSKFYPDANDFELGILIDKFTEETFYDFVRHSGATPDEEKEVLAAYDKLIGKQKAPVKKRAKKG